MEKTEEEQVELKSVDERAEQTPQKEMGYWAQAAEVFKSSKMLAYAALICALRIAVKAFSFQIAPGVKFTFDCYVNAIGALVYGPLMGLGVGAISDTIGCLLFPSGTYFAPFMLVEMSSSFLFAIFFWRRKITVGRALLAKFTVNVVCNLILTSLFMKWFYALYFPSKMYYLIDSVRIVKNLVLFPIEAIFICLLLNAFMPVFRRMRVVDKEQKSIAFQKKDVVTLILFFLLSVALVLLYVFLLKDFIADYRFRF